MIPIWKMITRGALCCIILVIASGFTSISRGQQPNHVYYPVKSGDTLAKIAERFLISIDDLALANPEIGTTGLKEGSLLLIPGMAGEGIVTDYSVAFWETLKSIQIRYQIPETTFHLLNKLTSPDELYPGKNITIIQNDLTLPLAGPVRIAQQQSLLELAADLSVNPWLLSEVNRRRGLYDASPNLPIYYQASKEDQEEYSISPSIQSIEFNKYPLTQGKTTIITIQTDQPYQLTGYLAGHELRFFETRENNYVALQGIYAMQLPGIAQLFLKGATTNGQSFEIEQMVQVNRGGYWHEVIKGVPPETIDPENMRPEDELIASITKTATKNRFWDNRFICPGYDPEWITSWFGTRRTYNDDQHVYFHTGIDYGGGVGLPITSPAPGVVVFTSDLTVRGKVTFIDHGWGVYSGFFHQSEIDVNVGDHVLAGQKIGLIGGTGRVTGAHLHWEVWVNGVQVDPLEWLDQEYP